VAICIAVFVEDCDDVDVGSVAIKKDPEPFQATRS
jgi:hypothetical protein